MSHTDASSGEKEVCDWKSVPGRESVFVFIHLPYGTKLKVESTILVKDCQLGLSSLSNYTSPFRVPGAACFLERTEWTAIGLFTDVFCVCA